jgi:hypothetical protein
MATTKAEFQDLADELINDEFADFRQALAITSGGTYNPVTESYAGATQRTYQAIKFAVDMIDWQGTDAQQSDTGAVYTRVDTFAPSVGDYCTLGGVAMSIVAIKLDAAYATVKLVLRAR